MNSFQSASKQLANLANIMAQAGNEVDALSHRIVSLESENIEQTGRISVLEAENMKMNQLIKNLSNLLIEYLN